MRIKRRINAECTYVHFLVFVYFGYICLQACYKPFCSLSVRPSVFVCIDLFLLSLTLGLIHSSAGQRENFWHSEGNVTAVTSETDTLPHSLTARREQRRKETRLVWKYVDIWAQKANNWCLFQCWKKKIVLTNALTGTTLIIFCSPKPFILFLTSPVKDLHLGTNSDIHSSCQWGFFFLFLFFLFFFIKLFVHHL